MKTISKSLLGFGLVLALSAQPALADKKDKDAAPAAPAPATAPVITGNVVSGIAVANLEAAIGSSDAYRVASQQRPVTYKSAYDSAQTRSNALEAQLKPLIDKFNADRAGGKVAQAVLQQQAVNIQSIQERGKQEIQQILYPAALSEAYVNEQIEDKLDTAVQQAMAKRGVTLLLQPQAVLARSNAYELTPEIIAQLNQLVPTAQLVPPQGWEPRQIREARAQQQAAQQGAKPASAPTPRPATPAGPQPDGR
jgi:Skp family chaperone for outer membrane proteins